MKHNSFAVIAALCLTSLHATSQGTIQPGFEAGPSTANPAPWSTFATLPDGNRVHFDGSTVALYASDGAFLSILHSFPSFSFVGAIAADPAGDSVTVGESSTGDVYRVELDGSGATHLTNLPYNYAASYESPGVVMISAAVCGFSCGNDLVRVDTVTGASVTVAHVSGPSGPVAFSSTGDLFYGISSDTFPAPAGSGAIWKFTAASLATGSLLTDLDAVLLCGGIDLVSSIAVDPVMGDLLVSTNLLSESFSVIADGVLLIQSDGTVKDVVSSGAGAYRSHVELHHGSGIGHFRAYQPEGITLTWMESDIIHAIDPLRPSALVEHHGGNSYRFEVTGAEPNGAMLVTFGDSSFHQGFETSYQLSFDFLFHTGLPINKIRRVGQFYMPCDYNGDVSFPFWDSGNLAGTIVFQGVITDDQGAFIGSSEAAFH